MRHSKFLFNMLGFTIKYFKFDPNYGGAYLPNTKKKAIVVNESLCRRQQEQVIYKAIVHHYLCSQQLKHFFIDQDEVIEFVTIAAPTTIATS